MQMHEEVTLPELMEAVARLSALLGPRQGGIARLEGGITNRNYRVNFGGTDYVVRLPGKRTELLGIDRESERIATKAAARLGVAPRVATMLDAPPCLVTSFIHGRLMTVEEVRKPETVEELARNLRSFHDSGVELPSRFDPFGLVERYCEIGRQHGLDPPDGYEAELARAYRVRDATAGLPDHSPVPCHNDLLTSNFLHDGERVQLIDWEYAGMGDRFFDLGNFAVNNELSDEDEERLLATYFGEPPDARRRATLKLFRLVSDLREAMWGVVQTGVSELDFDFSAYTRRHFDRLRGAGSGGTFEGWIEDARG
jgi:thiamine kinase-like enzyme